MTTQNLNRDKRFENRVPNCEFTKFFTNILIYWFIYLRSEALYSPDLVVVSKDLVYCVEDFIPNGTKWKEEVSICPGGTKLIVKDFLRILSTIWEDGGFSTFMFLWKRSSKVVSLWSLGPKRERQSGWDTLERRFDVYYTSVQTVCPVPFSVSIDREK